MTQKEQQFREIRNLESFIRESIEEGISLRKLAVLLQEKGVRGSTNSIRFGVAKFLKSKQYKDDVLDTTTHQYKNLTNNNNNSDSTSSEEESEPSIPYFSAQKSDGTIMDIKEYCETYGLPYDEMKSYKLITHIKGFATYNIASHVINTFEEEIDLEAIIDRAVEKHCKGPFNFSGGACISTLSRNDIPNQNYLLIVISDVHVGMDVNPDGFSLYGGKWDAQALKDRRFVIKQEVAKLAKMYPRINIVVIADLGDFLDGYDGKTVRREHSLPQNMSNEEMFDTGLDFKLSLLKDIKSCFTKETQIISYNVSNSNHSSSYDYVVNKAYKGIVEASDMLKKNTEIIIERKFVGHVKVGNHVEVFTHGKDDKSMKFGLKPKLDEKGREFIENYLKHHNLLGAGYNITVHKGDSHQLLFDRATSLDFNYYNYLSLAPASGWVQTNFNKSRSGFTIIVKDKDYNNEVIHNFEFEWESNRLK